jgi:hypothetical protein
MIKNEFDRIIDDKSNKIHDLESVKFHMKVFIPSHLLIQEENFSYNDKKSHLDTQTSERGFLVSIGDLENLITKNPVLVNSTLEKNSSINLIDWISDQEKRNILITKLTNERAEIEREMKAFLKEYM